MRIKWLQRFTFVVTFFLPFIRFSLSITSIDCHFTNETIRKGRCPWKVTGPSEIAQEIPGLQREEDHHGPDGEFLLFRFKASTDASVAILGKLESPQITMGLSDRTGHCHLAVVLKMVNFTNGSIKIVRRSADGSETELVSRKGQQIQRWQEERFSLGTSANNSQLMIELTRNNNLTIQVDSYVAIKRVSLLNCIQEEENRKSGDCAIKCSSTKICVTKGQICDLIQNCPDGQDEEQDCDKLPKGAYCPFDDGQCGWFLATSGFSKSLTTSGGALLLRLVKIPFSTSLFIDSPQFPPLPYFHSLPSSPYYLSCKIRFYHKFDPKSVFLGVGAFKYDPAHSLSHPAKFTRIERASTNSDWMRSEVPVPPFHSYSYNVSLEVQKSSYTSKPLFLYIDNVTLSRECFGIGVPPEEPRDPPPPQLEPTSVVETNSLRIPNSQNLTSYHFTSCGVYGRIGPRVSDCVSKYSNTSLSSITVGESIDSFPHAQIWTVPKTGVYSIFAKGARGGRSHGIVGGFGDLVSAVFTLTEGETVFVVVGQPGENSCPRSLSEEERFMCLKKEQPNSRDFDASVIEGGGGGGASYVFKVDKINHKPMPLIIAAGGSGAGIRGNRAWQNEIHRGENAGGLMNAIKPSNGRGKTGGGGWVDQETQRSATQGSPLTLTALGGGPCQKKQVYGGFGGGGGGGCPYGGGGGGYVGGSSYDSVVEDGQRGALSYVNMKLASMRFYRGATSADGLEEGSVSVFSQIENCCDNGQYPCVVVGQNAESGSLITKCVCEYEISHHSCENIDSVHFISHELIIVGFIMTITILVVGISMFFIREKYKRKNSPHNQNSTNQCNRDESTSQLLSNSSTDVQLSRLRSGHNLVTECNPNYEFGGSTCTLDDLRQIPREKLTLVKALGQGAFGEVYQGYLTNMTGEMSDEVAVAVKTLPEHSANNHAEIDFLMEALIMSKFKHRNIVRFIGVCFEKMPRFIVLELLSGGDLKTFLRESRATLSKPSPLCMGDLLVMALDVGRGCQYLEDNHFIHRDIAARNCLLTSKSKFSPINSSNYLTDGVFKVENYNNGFQSSGIVVKIADFGMARDIYRSDYYRKGGKAMLPVKWMPPEAFLDGIFTSKTDVWSFGVLLWEVMSMGFMPYPGRGNQEVMQLVTAGGRLEPPNNACPPQVYAIMQQCWQAAPDMRPNFATIIERLGYCLVDPDVLCRKLAIFHRAPSSERDATIMRPPPDSTDYLLPAACSNSNSNYSISTEKTELLSPDTCSTVTSNHDDSMRMASILEDEREKNPLLPPKRPEKSNKKANFLAECKPNPRPQDETVVLDPGALNTHHAPNRYVNVEMKDLPT